MITFNFEKYATPRTARLVKAGVGPAEQYAIPDQIIDAIDAVSGIAEKSIFAMQQDIRQDPSRAYRVGHPLDKYEMLQTVVATINRVSPEFATLIETAADEGRYVLETITQTGKSVIPIMEEIPAPPGKFGLLCEIDGTISSLRVAMHMAGRLVALDRSELKSISDDKLNRTHLLSLSIQGHFFERILFDTANKPACAAYSDADANLEKRTSAAFNIDSWMSSMGVYRSGIEYAKLLAPGDEELDSVLSSTGIIHTEINAPALIIATALYDVFSGKTPSGQKIILDQLYPAAGKYLENHGFPPVEALLAIVGAKDDRSLNQVFGNAADSLFPISPIAPVRQTLGLWIPTASDIQRYSH